jgi:hypothetical protein
MYQLYLLNTNPSQEYWYRKTISHDTVQSQAWNVRLCYIIVDCIQLDIMLLQHKDYKN